MRPARTQASAASRTAERARARSRSEMARPADRDALVHAHEVGRGVEARAEPGGAQARVQIGADRALAVGARHEQARGGALRMAQGGDAGRGWSPGRT